MSNETIPTLDYTVYEPTTHELTHLLPIRRLISRDLSEPYSIYVYRYFLHQWPDLCFMALDPSTSTPTLIGVIICKLEPHGPKPGSPDAPPPPQATRRRGYIAMLAVDTPHRGKGIATRLVQLAIDAMAAKDAEEIVLETEVSNEASLKLYSRLGFLKTKRLYRYYLNGNTAFRLVLELTNGGKGNDVGEGSGEDKPG